MPESTTNLLLNSLMGVFGGASVSVLINVYGSRWLIKDHKIFQTKLDVIAKKRELLLQHELEKARKKNDELAAIKADIARLQAVVSRLEES